MLIQVVHCHPLTDSYNHALFQTITAALEDNGHGVAATDLYREHFDPVMNASERRSYYAGLYDDTVVCAHTELLRRVDGIIFCFPHWWFSMPAMLKGYFDRVWAPGIAFERDLAKGYIRPLLNHIKVFGVVTTYGSPWWITRLIAGDPGRKVWPLCSYLIARPSIPFRAFGKRHCRARRRGYQRFLCNGRRHLMMRDLPVDSFRAYFLSDCEL